MKLAKHAWIIWSVALVFVIALMILIPFKRTAAWWIAAACTVIMFFLCAAIFVRAFRRGQTLESKLLGWPIFRVGYAFVIVQLIAGFVIMGIASFCPAWAAVIAELAVFAAAVVCLAVKDAAREAVRRYDSAPEDRTGPWKAVRARASAIAAATNHPELKKLAEEIRYADPVPTPMDGKIADMLETLSSYADAANIQKAFRLLEERKALAKLSK